MTDNILDIQFDNAEEFTTYLACDIEEIDSIFETIVVIGKHDKIAEILSYLGDIDIDDSDFKEEYSPKNSDREYLLTFTGGVVYAEKLFNEANNRYLSYCGHTTYIFDDCNSKALFSRIGTKDATYSVTYGEDLDEDFDEEYGEDEQEEEKFYDEEDCENCEFRNECDIYCNDDKSNDEDFETQEVYLHKNHEGKLTGLSIHEGSKEDGYYYRTQFSIDTNDEDFIKNLADFYEMRN